MRIISGRYKKTKLHDFKGRKIRPTTDFLKEVMFSVIFEFNQKQVLDLYAGTGALGLEAISRGAENCTFIDISYKAMQLIKKNIAKLNCSNQTKVIKTNALRYLNNSQKNYDLIFLDPPYNKNLVNKTLEAIFSNRSYKNNALIVIEHSKYEKIENSYRENQIFHKNNGEINLSILQCK